MLSIIVPTLDEASGIGSALAALAPLRNGGHEVIVVDGGSRDATAAIARPLADRVLHSPRGRAVQMNVGAHAAHGDVLLFLHADARLAADAVAAIERAISTGARWGRFDVVLDGRSRLLPVVAAFMNARSAVTGICTGDQALFVRRDAFEAAGGYPPIALMEDVALSAILKRSAGPPARLRGCVAVSGRRWDRHGAWKTIAAMWSLRYAFWRGADPADLARRYYGAAPPARPILQVFAKAPMAGHVKTRLAQAIGADAAVRAYVALAERTLDVASATRRAGVVDAVELWVAPAAPPDAFETWLRRAGATLHVQRGVDVGERMRDALRDGLARGRRALLIGTDVPGHDVPYLARAAASLDSHDAVVGPAEDGGYVLIGLARDVDAFSGVEWSTDRVMEQTRERLARAGARWDELPALWDVDGHAEWLRWSDEGPAPVAAAR